MYPTKKKNRNFNTLVVPNTSIPSFKPAHIKLGENCDEMTIDTMIEKRKILRRALEVVREEIEKYTSEIKLRVM